MLKMNLSRYCVAVIILLLSQLVSAAEKQPFDQTVFEQLQNDGKVVLVDVYAGWCPTCLKQQKILSNYLESHPSRELHILEVNFDDQKEALKSLKARRQSTLILYKGTERLWFSVAETSQDLITAEIEKAFE